MPFGFGWGWGSTENSPSEEDLSSSFLMPVILLLKKTAKSDAKARSLSEEGLTSPAFLPVNLLTTTVNIAFSDHCHKRLFFFDNTFSSLL